MDKLLKVNSSGAMLVRCAYSAVTHPRSGS